jgi:hypothetical protein
VGRAVRADEIGGALVALQAVVDGAAHDDPGFPGILSDLALDVRSYYEEAAVALSPHVPSARSAETWIFKETEAGRLMLQVVDALQARGAPGDVIGYMLPTWDR